MLTAVGADGGATLPAVHYCAAPGPDREQFVAVGNGTLTVEPSGAFVLVIGRSTGDATYHVNGAGVKVYDGQYSVGGTATFRGQVTTLADGTRQLAIPDTFDPDHLGAFGGRLVGDSALVTDRVACPYAIDADSTHTFTVLLK